MEYILESEINNWEMEVYIWYRDSSVNMLSIRTIPFNTSIIFRKTILDVIDKKGKILYLWAQNCENKSLVGALKERNKAITSYYMEDNEGVCDINFCNYNNIDKISGSYDLVIYDDVAVFSEADTKYLKSISKSILRLAKKVIFYDTEHTIKKCQHMDFLPSDNPAPFVEPRVLKTRINLNLDIPYILYEYLKWFAENKRKIIIYVPDEEKIISVYEYYTKKLKMKRIKIIPLLASEEKIIKQSVLQSTNESTIIITNCIEVSLENSHIGNAIVLFADDKRFTYKKLLFLCAEMRRINKELPEVLLVAKGETDNIEAVRDITREYNRLKWEENVLK